MKHYICFLLISVVGAIDLNMLTRSKVTYRVENGTQKQTNASLIQAPSDPPTAGDIPEGATVEAAPVFDPEADLTNPDYVPVTGDGLDEVVNEGEVEVFDPPPVNEGDVIADDTYVDVLPDETTFEADIPSDETDPPIVIPEPDPVLLNFLDSNEARLTRQFQEARQFANQHYQALGTGAIRVHVTGARIETEAFNRLHDVALNEVNTLREIEKVTGINRSTWLSVGGTVGQLAHDDLRNRHQVEIANETFNAVKARSDSQRKIAYDSIEGQIANFKRGRVELYKNMCAELLDTIAFRHENVDADIEGALHPFYDVCSECVANDADCNEVTIFGCFPGWTAIGGRCYRAFRAVQDFQTARAFCWNAGADLVKLDDPDTNAAVLLVGRRANLRNAGRFWIGASTENKVGDDGPFEWVSDGSDVSFTNNLEDSTLSGGNLCIESFAPSLNAPEPTRARAGEWNALDCSKNRLGYMCEM